MWARLVDCEGCTAFARAASYKFHARGLTHVHAYYAVLWLGQRDLDPYFVGCLPRFWTITHGSSDVENW